MDSGFSLQNSKLVLLPHNYVIYYHMCDLQHVHRHLNSNTNTSLANALVNSRLHNCKEVICKVGQNSLSTSYEPHDCLGTVCYISHIHNKLQWLSVYSNINFETIWSSKRCVLWSKYKCLVILWKMLLPRSVNFNFRTVSFCLPR